MIHCCSLHCSCLDEADSRRRAHDLFDTIVLKNLPELASMQHLTKYQPPMRKVGLALGIHSVFRDAFQIVASRAEEDDQQAWDDLQRRVDEGAAVMPEQEHFHRLKRSRLKFASGFVADPSSLHKVLLCQLSVQCLDDLVRLFLTILPIIS